MIKAIERIKTYNKGIGLVEILIVSAVMAVGLLSIISFLIFSRGVTFQLGRQSEATSLAEEGIEAVRNLRDESWTSNIDSLTSGTTYYPVISGDKWILSTTDPGPIESLYTRTVIVEDVSRDANDDIVTSGGTSDPNTKRITSTVFWTESGTNKEVELVTYITNILDN